MCVCAHTRKDIRCPLTTTVVKEGGSKGSAPASACNGGGPTHDQQLMMATTPTANRTLLPQQPAMSALALALATAAALVHSTAPLTLALTPAMSALVTVTALHRASDRITTVGCGAESQSQKQLHPTCLSAMALPRSPGLPATRCSACGDGSITFSKNIASSHFYLELCWSAPCGGRTLLCQQCVHPHLPAVCTALVDMRDSSVASLRLRTTAVFIS